MLKTKQQYIFKFQWREGDLNTISGAFYKKKKKNWYKEIRQTVEPQNTANSSTRLIYQIQKNKPAWLKIWKPLQEPSILPERKSESLSNKSLFGKTATNASRGFM